VGVSTYLPYSGRAVGVAAVGCLHILAGRGVRRAELRPRYSHNLQNLFIAQMAFGPAGKAQNAVAPAVPGKVHDGRGVNVELSLPTSAFWLAAGIHDESL
jgi:hypothetical protein